MKKTLVYHIYLCDDIDINKAYRINLECLKYFIHIFDKVIFVNVMDDLGDMALRKKGIDFISEIGYKGETNIIFKSNTEIGEAATVRDYVFKDDNDNDSIIFFGHTKGVCRFIEQKYDYFQRYSMFMWILVLYFYNFSYINELEGNFSGKVTNIRLFYGTLLMQYQKRKIPSIPSIHYSGSFYWVNKPFVKKMGLPKDYPYSSRYDAEFLPGYYYAKNDEYYTLFGSHNCQRLLLDTMMGGFYRYSIEEWGKVLDILGDKEAFLEFKKEIEREIGEI